MGNWICNEKPFISKSSFTVKEGITDRGFSTDCSSIRLFMHCIGITVQHDLRITIMCFVFVNELFQLRLLGHHVKVIKIFFIKKKEKKKLAEFQQTVIYCNKYYI